jgi:hypothetical protein
MTLQILQQVDARGLSCPMPIAKTALWLERDDGITLAGTLPVSGQGFGALVYTNDRTGPTFRSAIITLKPTGAMCSLAPGSSRGADASFAAKRSSPIDLENGLSSGGRFGVVDVDLVDVPHEPLFEPRSPSMRSEDVANESSRLLWTEFDCGDLLTEAPEGERRPPGAAQIAHPVCFAEWTDQAAPPDVLANRGRRAPRDPAPPAGQGDQRVGVDPDAQQRRRRAMTL